MELETSPFVFDGPVPPGDLVGRDDEVAALRNRAAHGRFVLLYAPRRYGKTSLIRRLEHDIALTKDMAVVVADLEGILTIDDLARRLEDAYRRLPQGAVRKALVRAGAGLADLGVELSAGPIKVSRPARNRDSQTATMVLEALLDLPYRVGTDLGTRVLVVLDEFQAINAIANADAIVRSRIQHQRDAVSYLFSGSEQGMLRAIFADRARPLYGQAEQLVLGPLGAEALAELIAGKFDETNRDPGDALAPLLRFVEGHPQRASFCAHVLWQIVGDGGVGEVADWIAARDAAVHAAGPEFSAMWSGVSDGQRRALRLIAHGEPLHGTAAARLGLGKSSATKAAKVLNERSITANEPSIRIIDPLFAEWIRDRQNPP